MNVQIIKELHKPARRNFPRRKVIVKGLNEYWQADLIEMQKYSKFNKGYRYILAVIDVFSKFAWTRPIKSKTAQDVTDAMTSILKTTNCPKLLHTDDGGEFFNSRFKALMLKNNIHHYSTYSPLKSSVVERFNRTIKEKIWQQFSLRSIYKYYDILDKLTSDYNSTKHRTIGMKPKDVKKNHVKMLLATVYNYHSLRIKKPKFKVGDKVRISNKHQFEKGYTPNWTTEISTIKRINPIHPITYLLEDFQGNPISGGFYEYELQKTLHPDEYLIEKILKRKGNKIFVKWLGFDNSFNSWTNKI